MIELPVTHGGWHWGMNRRRMGQRRRIEGDIAVRWLRRFVERNRATFTRDPVLSLPEGCPDHWWRDQPCLVLSAWYIVGGRDHGLPERLHTDAQMVTLPEVPLERRDYIR